MKQFRIILSLLLLSWLSACTVDIDGLSGRVDDLEARVEALEELCSQMNTNIGALQTIIDALQSNDYISSIAPIEEGEDIIGYVINFTKSGPVTLYHGQDGGTPLIGVRQDTDGQYYWTVDGEWLLDEAGNKIPASARNGSDGQDGITPQLKIEADGYWYISYDDGVTWTQLGKATGADGDSMFSGVTQDEDNVYLTLADGTVVTLPKARKLDLQFSETAGIACAAGQTVRVAYTLAGGNSETRIASIGEGGWTSDVEKTDEATGFIAVKAPSPITPGKVIVMADNNQGQTVMKTLTFEEGVLTVVADTYYAEGAAGEVAVHINTNITDYTVHIPEEARSWLSEVPLTRSEMRTDTLRFAVAEYPEGTIRRALVELRCAGQLLQAFTIEQTAIKQEVIEFADPLVKQILVESVDPLIDTDHDGEISYPEAERALTIPSFQGTMIKSFDELRYFTAVTRIPDGTFSECKVLTSVLLPERIVEIGSYTFNGCVGIVKIDIPKELTVIGDNSFSGCTNLSEIVIPEGVKRLEDATFSNCSNLSNVQLPSELEFIGYDVFQGCSMLSEINVPEKVSVIEARAFSMCSALKKVNLPKGLTSVANGAFLNCSSLEEIVLPEEIMSIGELAFGGCSRLKSIVIPQNVQYVGGWAFSPCDVLNQVIFTSVEPPVLGTEVFEYCPDALQILIPAGTLEAYCSALGWSEYVQYLVESAE